MARLVGKAGNFIQEVIEALVYLADSIVEALTKNGRWKWTLAIAVALAAGISVALLTVYFPPMLLAVASFTIKGGVSLAFLTELSLPAVVAILSSVAATTVGFITAGAGFLLSGVFNLIASNRLHNLSEDDPGYYIIDLNKDDHRASSQANVGKARQGLVAHAKAAKKPDAESKQESLSSRGKPQVSSERPWFLHGLFSREKTKVPDNKKNDRHGCNFF